MGCLKLPVEIQVDVVQLKQECFKRESTKSVLDIINFYVQLFIQHICLYQSSRKFLITLKKWLGILYYC